MINIHHNKLTNNLIITINLEDIDEVKQMYEEYGYYYTMCQIFEPYQTNGSYTFFDTEIIPIGLTNAPAIAESMEYDDQGNQTPIGNIWYFKNYQTENEIENLIKGIPVTFHNIS